MESSIPGWRRVIRSAILTFSAGPRHPAATSWPAQSVRGAPNKSGIVLLLPQLVVVILDLILEFDAGPADERLPREELGAQAELLIPVENLVSQAKQLRVLGRQVLHPALEGHRARGSLGARRRGGSGSEAGLLGCGLPLRNRLLEPRHIRLLLR